MNDSLSKNLEKKVVEKLKLENIFLAKNDVLN